MEKFSALLALCVGNSPVTGEFPSQRPVAKSFDVFFDLRLNTRSSEDGDLRRPRPHYDVIVMEWTQGVERLAVVYSQSNYFINIDPKINKAQNLPFLDEYVSFNRPIISDWIRLLLSLS